MPNPGKCPLCGTDWALRHYRNDNTFVCGNCPLPTELWPAVQRLKDERAEALEENARLNQELDYEAREHGKLLRRLIGQNNEVLRLNAELAAVKEDADWRHPSEKESGR